MSMVNGCFESGNVLVSSPYYISGKSGALTLPAAASPVATLVNFGRVDPKIGDALLPVPIRVSQARMRFVLTSGATATPAFEIYKGSSTVQRDTGGNLRAAVRKKTLGYEAIPTAQVSLYIATTGATSGGNFTPEGDPLDMVGALCGVASPAVYGFGASQWQPFDLCGVSLEAGEGLEVRVTQPAAAVGILLVVFDFLRQ